jgi:signal transduction histidine kinase/CheY-like chemotaxis protein
MVRMTEGAARQPKSLRDARWALGLFVAYSLGSELGYALSLGPSVGGTFWPPAGIALAFLLARPTGSWPSLLAAAAVANYLSDWWHGQTLWASVGFAAANLSEPLVGAWLLRRTINGPVTFSRLTDLGHLALIVVFVSAPIGAGVGAAFAQSFTVDPPAFAVGWRTWWVGDAVGALVLTPFVMRIITDWHRLPSIAGRTWIEAAGFAVATIVVTQLVFRAPPTSAALSFLVFPVLMWGSLRLGVVAVGAALCTVVVLTARDTALGLGPFAAPTLVLGDRLIALQIYVGVMALTFHGLAALWEERTRTTRALQQTHSGLAARHRRIVEQSPLAIAAVQPDGTVLDANPAWQQRWAASAAAGVTRSPAPDRGFTALLAPAFEGSVIKLPERDVAVDAGAHTTVRRVRGFAYPVKDERDGVAEVVVIEEDITDQFAARQQLIGVLAAERTARNEAERASQLKDEFLSTLSHELRTPLHAVLGWAQILRSSPDAATMDRAVDAVSRNARAQARLVEDLLDMSRILAGKVTLAPSPTPIGTIVASAIDALRPVASAKGTALTLSDGAPGARVSGEAARLEQVMTNLLDNAVKFTPAGGSVSVRLSLDTNDVRIDVEDTGEGIRPEFLSVIFERFRQADGSTTRRHGGLGLGLSIAHHIVEMHGGSLHAHSDGVGRGATFTLRLPLSQTTPTGDTGRIRDHTVPLSLVGLRVLVTDDNEDARELLRRLLTDHGADVTCATSGNEALRALDEAPFDVLLTDIGMPGMDGYELARRVRAAGHRQMTIVAVTAFARSEDRSRALAMGFDGHVPKPATAMRILEVLGACRPASSTSTDERAPTSEQGRRLGLTAGRPDLTNRTPTA